MARGAEIGMVDERVVEANRLQRTPAPNVRVVPSSPSKSV
jgi:hypothetical protein